MIFFAVVWWVYIPHDGRQEITSPAQKEIMEAGGGGNSTMTPEERAQAAFTIWNEEKGTAMAIIIIGWLIKVEIYLTIHFSTNCSQMVIDILCTSDILVRHTFTQRLLSRPATVPLTEHYSVHGPEYGCGRRRRRRLLHASRARTPAASRTHPHT